jgi:hypothetical protein
MRLNIYIASLILILSISCKKSSPETINPGQINMNRVEGAITCNLDQTITLTVYYPTSSGCDVFDRFEQSIKGKIVSIRAFGHTETSTFCIQAAIERNITLDFIPTSTGLYELRFINRDNTYFTHNLTVN